MYRKIGRSIIGYATLLLFSLSLSSCLYKMPNDDNFSVIPITNNPNFIQDEVNPSSALSQMAY